MVSVCEKRGEGQSLQPVEGHVVRYRTGPQAAEVTADEDVVAAVHGFPLREEPHFEAVEVSVGISCAE